MKYPGIPAVPPSPDSTLYGFLRLLKENVERLNGALAGPVQVIARSYPVAALPANVPGQVVYATDGRKPGEAAGKGSGVLVFSDATKWCSVSSGVLVTR